jgi:hypothetical protein
VLSFFAKGSFARTESYLRALSNLNLEQVLARSGARGVAALASATPRDSGLAANSWAYKVEGSTSSFSIYWYNTDVESGFPVAVMIKYGHGTGTGGYVPGRNYVTPAIVPVFDQIEADIRKAVTSIR